MFFETGTLKDAGSDCWWATASINRVNRDHTPSLRFSERAMIKVIATSCLRAQPHDGHCAEDRAVVKTIHFRPGTLTKSDATLARFLDYVRDFPRAHPRPSSSTSPNGIY